MSEDSSNNRGSEQVLDWVDSFLDNEESIRNFFDRVSERQHEGDESRKLLRKFSEESRPREAIAAIYFTMIEFESFFEDVIREYDEETLDRLKNFASDYSHLEREIDAVYGEKYFHKLNPITSGNSEISHVSPQGDPFMKLLLYSGDTLSIKTQNKPSMLLNLSALIVHNIDRTLSEESRQWKLTKGEKEDMLEEIEHIERHLDELKETAKIEAKEEDQSQISHGDE